MALTGRQLSLVLAAVVLLVSPSVGAQKADGVRRIGYLTVGSDFTKGKTKKPGAYRQAFLRGLAERGFVPGKNLAIEYRFADGEKERLPALAAELLDRKVEVIFGWSDAALVAAKATKTVPVVFAAITDPVANGLVQSLAHPGGNVTGLSNQGLVLNGKRLQLLKEAVPAARRVAVLAHRAHSLWERIRHELDAAAPSLGVQLQFFDVRAPDQIAGSFLAMKNAGAQALLLQEYSQFTLHARQIANLALDNRLPTMCFFVYFVKAGCFMSYGPDFLDIFRRAGVYVAKILEGAKPAELPVERPTKFELTINMKTAKALGITIPPSILLRADRVIE